jgi:hypothetical protein
MKNLIVLSFQTERNKWKIILILIVCLWVFKAIMLTNLYFSQLLAEMLGNAVGILIFPIVILSIRYFFNKKVIENKDTKSFMNSYMLLAFFFEFIYFFGTLEELGLINKN